MVGEALLECDTGASNVSLCSGDVGTVILVLGLLVLTVSLEGYGVGYY